MCPGMRAPCQARRHFARSGAPAEASFTDEDRQWVIERCPTTLEEIEKSTLRLLALKMSPKIPGPPSGSACHRCRVAVARPPEAAAV